MRPLEGKYPWFVFSCPLVCGIIGKVSLRRKHRRDTQSKPPSRPFASTFQHGQDLEPDDVSPVGFKVQSINWQGSSSLNHVLRLIMRQLMQALTFRCQSTNFTLSPGSTSTA